jgi:BTB/POZ domain
MSDHKPTFWSSMLMPFKSALSESATKDKVSIKRAASTDAETEKSLYSAKKPRSVDAAGSATTRGIQFAAAVASNRLSNVATSVANTDSDDDIEPVVPQSLHWRSHPESSDWTIEVWTVADISDVTVQRYPVHKSVLALESLLFAKIFTEDESQTTRTSRFDFAGEAAILFPKLLDYLYAPSSLVLTTENAAVGQILGLPRLRWEAKQFWTADLNLNTVGSYYQQAVALDIGKLLAAVTNACASEDILLHLAIDSPLLQVPRVEALLDLVQTVGPMHSDHLSVLVAKFCSLHFSLGIIDQNVFCQLTNPDKMPGIDQSVVFALLDLEHKIRTPEKHEGKNGDELSSLQERCLATLEQCWETIDFEWERNEERNNTLRSLHTDSKGMTLLRNQSPAFLLALWQRTLSAAQNSRSALKTEPTNVKLTNRTATEYLTSDTENIQDSKPEPCDDASEPVGMAHADLVNPTVW